MPRQLSGLVPRTNFSPSCARPGQPGAAVPTWFVMVDAFRGRVDRDHMIFLAEVAEEDYVAGYVASDQEQLFSVARQGKAGDTVGGEVCDLAGRSAGQRLLPDVGGSVSEQSVLKSLS